MQMSCNVHTNVCLQSLSATSLITGTASNRSASAGLFSPFWCRVRIWGSSQENATVDGILQISPNMQKLCMFPFRSLLDCNLLSNLSALSSPLFDFWLHYITSCTYPQRPPCVLPLKVLWSFCSFALLRPNPGTFTVPVPGIARPPAFAVLETPLDSPVHWPRIWRQLRVLLTSVALYMYSITLH